MTLLPPNATFLERSLESVIDQAPPPIALGSIIDPDTCPIDLLPWLAWSLSIENWSNEWPEATKREAVKKATYVQSIKGTREAVESAVTALGGTAFIVEWFEQNPPKLPHTFLLAINLRGQDGQAPTEAYIDSVIAEVNRTKPARSHFDFTVTLAASGSIALTAIVRVANSTRLSLTEA
jgi:phage tail P2-like protein